MRREKHVGRELGLAVGSKVRAIDIAEGNGGDVVRIRARLCVELSGID